MSVPSLNCSVTWDKAEFGERTHFLHTGQPGEFAFDGLRDELFRFFGGQRGNFGVDLHLDAGDVRHGVNRQMQRRPEARPEQRERAQQHDCALTQGEFEDAVNHG